MLLVPAGNPSPWTGPTGNNTYLLMGRVPTLVDAGVGNPPHIDAVDALLNGRALAAVIVTHAHPDHVNGVPTLVDRWPNVTVRNVAPDRCTDGEAIVAGDTVLRAIHTPGHAPDHFCFLDETTGDVYCGDLVRLGGTIVIPASAGGSLTAYLGSLRRIRDLRPRRLLPGHGPIVDDPDGVIAHYLRHRAEREVQIVDALRQGDRSVEAIVSRIYGVLDPALLRAARDSVLAHLIKLQDEGHATVAADEWRPLT